MTGTQKELKALSYMTAEMHNRIFSSSLICYWTTTQLSNFNSDYLWVVKSAINFIFFFVFFFFLISPAKKKDKTVLFGRLFCLFVFVFWDTVGCSREEHRQWSQTTWFKFQFKFLPAVWPSANYLFSVTGISSFAK